MTSLSLTFSHKYKQLFTEQPRYIHLWGGRGRGGSFTATQYALHLMTQSDYFRGYIMREVAEDIRGSLWMDFKDRVDAAEIESEIHLNDTGMTAICLDTGNVLLSKGFKKSSGKRTAKLKSLAGATHVIIEEAEEISEEDFNQLDDSLRTTKANVQIIMIFNPPAKNHWIWRKWYNLVDTNFKDPEGKNYFKAIPKTGANLLSVFSTYHDNVVNLNATTVANFEAYKTSNPDHYYTMVMGLISEGMRGRIYRNWQPVDAMPGFYTKFYGLDWGFNDPIALVECEASDNKVWAQEMIYERGLTNNKLVRQMELMGISKSSPIYADSANPKDIEDLKDMGWNIIKAEKPKGSVISGIKYIQDKEVFLTQNSVNLWEENRNYKWLLDQNKNPMDEPEDKNNHGMDALRYAMDHLRQPVGFMGATTIR